VSSRDQNVNEFAEVEVTEEVASPEQKPRSLAFLPIVLGVFVLFLNLVLFTRQRGIFLAKNAGGTAALGLLALSVLIGILLIIYPVLARRTEAAAGGDRAFARWVVVPLALGLLAPMLSVRAVENYYPTTGAQNSSSANAPCLELYEKASAIRAENPRFRMPDNDRDERRCKINETVLR
jgi:hypothetical protein